MAKTFAVYDGQRRSLRVSVPTNIETVEAAVRSAFGFGAANLEFSVQLGCVVDNTTPNGSKHSLC